MIACAFTKQENKLPPPALSGSGVRVTQPRSQPKISTPVFLFDFCRDKAYTLFFRLSSLYWLEISHTPKEGLTNRRRYRIITKV